MRMGDMKTWCAFGIAAASLLASTVVSAEKPEWTGRGKHGKLQQNETQERQRSEPQSKGQQVGGYFADEHRAAVRSYYSEQYRTGRCPPGLAKKNNGCMPPGQARKWSLGRPLPRDVIYYSVPPAVVVQLGVPPAGHRYVRVASDILLIAIGTGIVIDAIEDLGGR